MGIFSPGTSNGGFQAQVGGYNLQPAQVTSTCWVYNPASSNLDLFSVVGLYSSGGQFWMANAYGQGRWGAAGTFNNGALNPATWPSGWFFMGQSWNGSTLTVVMDGLQGSLTLTPAAANPTYALFLATIFENSSSAPAIDGTASGVAIAECAWWGGALGIDDLLNLQAGANPLEIKSAPLMNYWPLRSDLLDRGPARKALAPSVAGVVPNFTTHPPVRVARRTPIYFLKSTAPPADTGTGADTLGTPTQSADGVLSVSGTATDATAPPSDAASAAASATGAGSDATSVPSGAGVGSGSVSGSGAGAVPAPSDAGVGAVSISGSEMEILADASASGSAQVGANVSGSGTESAPGPSDVAAGAAAISGSEAESAPSDSASAAGTAAVAGSDAETTADASASGSGSVSIPGEIAGGGAGSVTVAGAGAGALISEVPASRVIPLWPSPLRLPDKAASETMDYAIDASALLASPSDTLSVVAACPSLTVAQALVAGSQIVLLLAGGTSGADNAVDVQISAASGRFVHRIVRVLTQ